MDAHYVYILRDPETNRVRYVGCTKRPKWRKGAHRTCKTKPGSAVEHWVVELASCGLRPKFQIVARFADVSVLAPNGLTFSAGHFARAFESQLIDKLRNAGCQLLNADMEEVRARAKRKHAERFGKGMFFAFPESE